MKVINLSEAASNAILDALGALMDGGRIVLFSKDQTTLAVLPLSNPAARKAAGGTLTFNNIAKETSARSTGVAVQAQIRAANGGGEIFSCDVGTLNSNAVIKLKATNISQGGEVEIASFELRVP